MAILDTVADYIAAARVLLMDQVASYRYSDDEIVRALNLANTEAMRLRPDLFFYAIRTNTITTYASASPATYVDLPYRFRTALLYYIVGHCQLRDDEETTDERAAALLNKFVSQLTMAGT
jgi:hypothetical protein